MKASIKVNTRLHQRYDVAVFVRLRTTISPRQQQRVTWFCACARGWTRQGLVQECVHLGLSISIVKKICSVLFALDESWTAWAQVLFKVKRHSYWRRNAIGCRSNESRCYWLWRTWTLFDVFNNGFFSRVNFTFLVTLIPLLQCNRSRWVGACYSTIFLWRRFHRAIYFKIELPWDEIPVGVPCPITRN